MTKQIMYDPATKRFTQVNDPPKVKPLEIVLTDKEKERVIKEFIEVMEREPTQEEIEELFLEELKLKHLDLEGQLE